MRIRKRPSLPSTTTRPSSEVLITNPPLKPDQQQIFLPPQVGNNNDDETKTTHSPKQVFQSVNLPKLAKDHLHNHQHDPLPKSTSDLQLTIIRGEDGWICLDKGDERRNQKKKELFTMNSNSNTNPSMEMKEKNLHCLLEEEEEDDDDGKYKSNERSHINTRKRNGSNVAEAISDSRVPSYISFDQEEVGIKWEEEEVLPVRKRSNEMSCDRDKPIGRTEGSRCSRVNGSGWRCGQQPLIGYSLCEHHLGKGRLIKSMNKLQRHSTSISIDTTAKETKKIIMNDQVTSVLDENEVEEDKPLLKHMNQKRKKKTGKVKARSLSSLLAETQHGIY